MRVTITDTQAEPLADLQMDSVPRVGEYISVFSDGPTVSYKVLGVDYHLIPLQVGTMAEVHIVVKKP